MVLRDADTAAGWSTWKLDTMGLEVGGDVFLGVGRPGGQLWGDAAPDAHRTLLAYGDGWRPEPSFGNLLVSATWSYPGQPVLYQVHRAGAGSGYALLADSLATFQYRDTAVAAEGRYRYLVKTIWTLPSLYAGGYPLAASVDYLAPRIGDSLRIVFTDSTAAIGATVTDGIGVLADSIHPQGGDPAGSDSTVAGVHWYHLAAGMPSDTLRFCLTACDSAGNASRSPASGWHQVVWTGVAGQPTTGLPTCYALGTAFPNPSAHGCQVNYQLPVRSPVNLSVYNVAGQLVRTIEHAEKGPGYYRVRWDGRNRNGAAVSAGLYFLRLRAGNYAGMRKLLIVR
ncbi:MAG: T9SS type A sorting domain-containing protein [Candidatus Edwardsbacteria bacterium]|nr:T9SS type A sorting domain-containing protein [Candidatus Edwardsbacteria bacterium]